MSWPRLWKGNCYKLWRRIQEGRSIQKYNGQNNRRLFKINLRKITWANASTKNSIKRPYERNRHEDKWYW
jgi:hypothetical protein